jgi:methionyl-tRNA formyltransferase
MSKTLSSPNICIVTAGGPYPWIIANAVIEQFGALDVILEQPEAMTTFLKRRARKVGWLSVVGQVGTMALSKFGKKGLASRIERLVQEENLLVEAQADQRIISIDSINSVQFTDAINDLKPNVILLIGSRLMKTDILRQMPCPVLNYHAGITPQYRGMNGGYWALATGDIKNFGTTVHLVDAGVDTGAILKQVRGAPAKDDNIMTYAHRQAAMSRGICIEAIDDALSGKLMPIKSDATSKQWYHPPIWTYVWNGLTKRVW